MKVEIFETEFYDFEPNIFYIVYGKMIVAIVGFDRS